MRRRIGPPSGSGSATANLPSSGPRYSKFSGSTINDAPSALASRVSSSTRVRFFSTSSVQVSCRAATLGLRVAMAIGLPEKPPRVKQRSLDERQLRRAGVGPQVPALLRDVEPGALV